MKKIILIILFFFIISFETALWNNTKSFSTENKFDLYKKRVENFCSDYKKTDSKNEIIYTLNESKYFFDLEKNKPTWFKIWDDLKIAKQQYEKNMDDIFECATLSSYQRWLEMIKNSLIKQNPKLNSRLKSKIEQKVKELKNKMNKLWWNCKIKNNWNNLVKFAVLNQTTYETCKYNFYLEYLKEFNNDLKNLVDTSKEKNIPILSFTKKYNEKINMINSEIEHTYKTFPLVLQAYNDYENNISNHILLELIKEDYEVFRIWLHKTLNPINQVIYKISNAMRK